jgi:hypothetical protein
MRWPHHKEPLLDHHFQIARTSATIDHYNGGKWLDQHHPHETNATKTLFEKELHHHTKEFHADSDAMDDHNLNIILGNVRTKVKAVEHKHKNVFGKAKAKAARQDASYYFQAIVQGLDEKEQYFLFNELKADFLEYLLMPFYVFSCCKFTQYELKHTACVQGFIIAVLILCLLFYALCFWWLWLAVGVLNNADATLKDYLIQHCQVIPIGKLDTYFNFRLAVYFLSPLSLLAIAISSHMHQRVLLQRLTGIPSTQTDTYNTKSLWHNKIPIVATLIVMLVNVIFGAATMALDILLLQGFQRWAVSDVDKGCSALVHGMMVDQPPPITTHNTTTTPAPTERLPTSTLDIKPTLADIPIPLLTFNLLYTLWGLLYVLAVSWCRPDLISDEDTTIADELGLGEHDRMHMMHEQHKKWEQHPAGTSVMHGETHRFVRSEADMAQIKERAAQEAAAQQALLHAGGRP